MKKITLLLILNYSFLIFNSFAQAPNWLWAMGAGGGNSEFGGNIAVDASGNRYITGSFASPTIAFGSTTLTNASAATDIFIAKYDVSGNALWAIRAGGTSGENGNSIAVDGSGNVYVTGMFMSSTISFDTITLTNSNSGSPAIFIVKFNPSGNVLWAKSAGGTGTDTGTDIAVDGSGNSYTTGIFGSSSITFGSTTLTNASFGTYDIFIVKCSPSGNVLWATRAGGTSDDSPSAICIDGSGNSYITGHFNSPSIVFGSTTLTGSGGDIFIAKYDGSGNPQWAASPSFGGATDVALDASGNSFICGSFSASITFGSTTLTSAGLSDMFVAKYNTSGSPVWATSVGGSSYEGGSSLMLDGSGNIYVAGYFQSPSVTLGSTTLTLLGGSDIFVTKYSPAGNVLWATSAGGAANDLVNGLALDGSGNSHLIGTYYSPTMAFGSNTLNNSGGNADVYVAKLSGVVGINEINGKNFISLSPNPVTSELIIDNGELKMERIEIYNVLGEKVFEKHLSSDIGHPAINVADFPSGVYFVRAKTIEGTGTGKFVKE